MTNTDDQQTLQDEIAELERRLKDAKARLKPAIARAPTNEPATNDSFSALHALLLLSDSALPLGSFAFSSGLESYLAHHKASPSSSSFSTKPSASYGSHTASQQQSHLPAFYTFLKLSLATLASTALPYVLSGWRNPERLEELDNDFDASTACTVARRASVAQGRALVAVWERSFRSQYLDSSSASSVYEGGIREDDDDKGREAAIAALADFSLLLKKGSREPYPPSAHLAPLWGTITRILALPLRESAYLFLFSHARTIMSAAVRASVMGPYQAQQVLASGELQERIRGLVEEGWHRGTEEAGQSVPVMDLWVGRHERLYSRIFNS